MPDEKQNKRGIKMPGLGRTEKIISVEKKKIEKIVLEPVGNIEVKQPAPDYISIKLLRQYDLLSVELRFKNFTRSGNQLIKKSDPALMMVVFQPQSIAEECGTEDINGLQMPSLPANMFISDFSRLVFTVNKSSLLLNANDLLDWDNYELVVDSRAKGIDKKFFQGTFEINKNIDALVSLQKRSSLTQLNNTKGLTKDTRTILNQRLVTGTQRTSFEISPNKSLQKQAPGKLAPTEFINPTKPITNLVVAPVSPPGEWETSLEIPFRLFLSPTKSAGWNHEIKLHGAKGIVKVTNLIYELWHTRMGTKTTHGIDESDLTAEDRLLRILWGETINKDYKNIPPPTIIEQNLGNTSINDFNRHQLVHESSNFSIPNFTPQPVKAYKLFLTTLGACLDSLFVVDRAKLIPAASPLSLLKWRHIQTLAREHYVELVQAGNIMPFGHEAVLIEITERKPHARSLTATNFKRQIVVITEHVKDYNYRDSKGVFMNFCFSQVEMITTATPLLDATKKKLVKTAPLNMMEQFVITSGGKDVQFKIKAEDLNGNISNFQMPLVFASSGVLSNDAFLTQLITAYNGGVFVQNHTELNGQKISLAPPEPNACNTSFAAYHSNFTIMKYSNAEEVQGFLPNLGETNIIEPSYQRITGGNETVRVSLEDDKNAGHVFAKFNFAQPVNFGGHADKTGGFAMPNFELSGLSKTAGAFGGDINQFKNAAATAESYFTNGYVQPDAVLFGVFKLSDILEFPASDPNSYDLSKALINRMPKIPGLTTEETATEIITSYVVKPNLKKITIGDFVSFTPTPAVDSFSIVTQAIVNKSNPTSIPTFSTEAKMKAFEIGLMGELLKIKFQQIQFTASPGKSADVNIDMQNPAIEFGGPLSFINAFQQLIPPAGFSDPPYLDVSLTGVKCGYTLALPNLQLGAFTLSNLTLGADVNLPFTGAPLVMGFRFCEKQQPFNLTISLLGGGGYFGFEADLNGLRQIDAAFEFGAAVSLNLGVASGSVSIMAGIYFRMIFTDGQNSTELTGYVRINGAMSILGLITASIELYMALTYLMDQQKAYGEASVSIKVSVLFFNKTVTVHTSRTFAGSGADPNFQMTYSPDKWKEYCEAFAA